MDGYRTAPVAVKQPRQPFGSAAEEVAKNSPADAVGLRASRVVAKIEGYGSGDEMTFKVLRAGRVIELKGRVP